MHASGSRVQVNADANLVVRVEEFFYSYKQASAANTQASQLAKGQVNIGGALPSIFGNNTDPAGSTLVEVAGRHILSIPSGAAIAARHSNVGDVAAIPVNQLFQDANSIPIPLLGRPLRQYLLTVPVRRTVAGTAIFNFGLGISTNMLSLGGASPAAVWSSDPAVNAGRFLPRSRRVNAGAVTDGPDSQVTPTGWHLLGMRYTEGVTPLLEWLLDGVPMHLISGDAAMLVFPGGVNPPGFEPGYGLSTPAGSTWQFGTGVFEVKNIGV